MSTTLRASKDTSLPSYAYEGELKRALDVADTYGFRLFPPLKVEADDREHAEHCMCPEHHIAALKTFDTHAHHHPDGVGRFVHTRKVPYKNKLELRLEIVGDRDSSAEGLLFQTAQAILREYGFKEPTVTVNTVGSKESTASFTHAVAGHFRTRLNDMHPDCRTLFKKSPLAPLRCAHPECIELRADAPQSLNFLTEQSKQHFKEVLEYLEVFDIPYIVDPLFVGSEHYTTRTIFKIHGAPARGRTGDDPEEPIAWGERYDQLAKKIGLKRSMPAVNLTLDLRTKNTKEVFREKTRTAPIMVHVIHAGMPAKRLTLKLAEDLRGVRIKTTMWLHKNSVTEQLEQARLVNAPILLIVGQKEVLDGTVMVRYTATSHQEVVPFARVARYLQSHL